MAPFVGEGDARETSAAHSKQGQEVRMPRLQKEEHEGVGICQNLGHNYRNEARGGSYFRAYA